MIQEGLGEGRLVECLYVVGIGSTESSVRLQIKCEGL